MERSRILAATVVLVLGAYAPDLSRAVDCLDDPGDAAQIAATRDAIEIACKCFGVASHGRYVSCATRIANDRAEMALLRDKCKRTVKRIYAHSVCGKETTRMRRKGPLAPCVAHNTVTGTTSCAVKPAESCQWTGSTERVACLDATNCLEAADTNGDLEIAGPGDGGDCASFPGTLTDNGDGTITDSRTSLMWEKLSDDGSIHDWDDLYTLDGPVIPSTDKISALNAGGGFAGHADWRLPTIHELMTLLRAESDPAVPAEFDAGCAPGCSVLTCSCTAASWYWASTSAGSRAHFAADLGTSVSLSSGGAVYELPTATALRVRAVRAAS